LELSHEIDYAKWIFGNFTKIFCKVSKVSNLKVNVEDNAKILLFSKDKFTVNINLDFCRKDKVRKCEVVGAKGTLVWNSLNNKVIYYNASKKKWLKISFKKNDIKSTYLLQLKEMFTACISKKKINGNLVSYTDAYNTMKLIDSARKSSRHLKVVNVN
jgi:predicted dehydrogenase